MMSDTLSNAHAPLHSLKLYVSQLQDLVCLTTGMGLVEMWTKWKSSNAIPSPDSDVYNHSDFCEILNSPAINSGRSMTQIRYIH